MKAIFLLSKDRQGFPARRTAVRRSRKTRGGCSSAEKGPFLDGHEITFQKQGPVGEEEPDKRIMVHCDGGTDQPLQFQLHFLSERCDKTDKNQMPGALWEKVIREIGEKEMARTLFFHVLGEPLLSRDLFDAIRLANRYNLAVSLHTNGALLDEKRSSNLL